MKKDTVQPTQPVPGTSEWIEALYADWRQGAVISSADMQVLFDCAFDHIHQRPLVSA